MRTPHRALRPFVTRYIGYRQHDVTLEVHRGLPSRHVTLIISLADPIRVLGMPGDQQPAALPALVGGLQVRSALIAQDRYQCGLHLELNPLGARALLGAPSAALAGLVLDLADLQRPALAALPERLREAPDWPRRFEILDQVLGAALAGEYEPPPEVRWAWRRMIAVGGAAPVAELAGEVGWSRRHFTELFRREVGLTPKQAARVMRFERARTALDRAPRTPLADLAVACGYYDQAHLSNEWRAMAGCSPRTWIAEEFPSFQGDPA